MCDFMDYIGSIIFGIFFVILYSEIDGKICIKPLAEDAEISNVVRVNGCWEPDNVRSVLLALKKFPTATLLGPINKYA